MPIVDWSELQTYFNIDATTYNAFGSVGRRVAGRADDAELAYLIYQMRRKKKGSDAVARTNPIHP